DGESTGGPKTLNPYPAPDHVVNAPTTTNDEPGEGRVIATGVDDEAKRYRDHQQKRLWPLNQVGPLRYRMYVGDGPELAGEVDATGTLSMTNPLTVTTPKHKTATINSLPLDTNRTPDKIWEELASYKAAKGAGNIKWHPVLVTTHGHSNAPVHMISHITGGGHFDEHSLQNDPNPTGYPAWVTNTPKTVGNTLSVGNPQKTYTVTVPDYKLNTATTPDLQAVTFFNMMGCKNSVTSAGSHSATAAGMSDIAQVVSSQKKAGNSMGYSTLTVFKSGIGRWPGQMWFDALYDKSNFSVGTAYGSASQAEDIYVKALEKAGIKEGCPTNGSSPNWGWDQWVVTDRDIPILDR
ncbi:MAG: hypothetical protein M3347_13945, partial [Armatimonadota bacterium]|nr:hypothetical protein [Armatimonadota bacterium]